MSGDKQEVAYPYIEKHSVIKGNKLPIHATTWMKFEKSMKEDTKRLYCMIPFI